MNYGRKPLNESEVLYHKDRKDIFEALLKESHSITSLCKNLKINRGTLKHHLKIMERFNLITISVQDNVKGKPAIIKLKEDKK